MKKQPKDYIFQRAKKLKAKPKRAIVEDVKPLPFKKGRRKKCAVRLEYLNPGERFEFCNLKGIYRGAYVKRPSSCSVNIGGEIYDDVDQEWKKLGSPYYVAPSCMVNPL